MARGEGSTWGLGEAAAVAAPGEREAERALSPSAVCEEEHGRWMSRRSEQKIAWARQPLVCGVERASMGRESA